MLDMRRWIPYKGFLRFSRDECFQAALLSCAQVAQLVEHMTENHGVGGSIPPLGAMRFV